MAVHAIADYITKWLKEYAEYHQMKGFVVGISGGIDSAVTSLLCARTGLSTLLLHLPIRQTAAENQRAQEHLAQTQQRFTNVKVFSNDLTPILSTYENTLPAATQTPLNMANVRARIRMTTLYAYAGAHQMLVAGTGNKIEDFGVGFFTKYGDGGVDISPIGDLYKSEVFVLARCLNVVTSIVTAPPTDGLFEEGLTDEQQLGASYNELEWAMQYNDTNEKTLSDREREVLAIYRTLHQKNQHKMQPIPVCDISEFRAI